MREANPNSPWGIRRQEWRGRDAVCFSNDRITCTVLRKGGSIAELRSLSEENTQNLLWEAPWLGPDVALNDAQAAERYGDVNSGRFLHHYTGHALCLDGFGPASAEEVSQGGGLHGEAIRADWNFEPVSENELRAEALLPAAQLVVQRAYTLLPTEVVLRVKETVTNIGTTLRNIHWVQHATVGTPAFGSSARLTTSAREGQTWPLDYEGRNALKEDAPFTWPMAPGASGEPVDLSALFPVPQSGFVAGVKQPRDRDFAFVAAQNANSGVVLAYIYPAMVFPWLTLWEENKARVGVPWNGEVCARGLEFGTTPFPLGNEVVDAQGPVLGVATSHPLCSGEAVTAHWILAAVQLPAGYGDLRDIDVEENSLVLCCTHNRHRVEVANAEAFLANGGEQ